MDTTVMPPAGMLGGAIQPWSLPSLGSALADGPFCPECDRDLSADESSVRGSSSVLVVCETCADAF